MKKSILIQFLFVILLGLLFNVTQAQQTITLNPSEDAQLRICLEPGYTYLTTTNDGASPFFRSDEWTIGSRIADRSVMKFNLASIPSGALITSAKLSLYAQSPQYTDDYRQMNAITTGNSGYKLNACYLEKITQDWNETTVTWANQPPSSPTVRIILPESQTYTQDYPNLDVTAMVQDMIADPANSYGFMLRLVNEVRYARMAFCSRNHPNANLWPKLTIEYELPAPTGKISSGWLHSLLLKTDGSLWAWGENSYGQLGDGTYDDKLSAVQVGIGSTWSQIAAGGMHYSLAIKTNGTLWGWGDNGDGELGGGPSYGSNSPIQIGTGSDWKQISAGYNFSLAIKTDGTLWATGNNEAGAIGNGGTATVRTWVKIGTETNWKQISAGYGHSLAIKTNGTLWAWGYNAEGELGDGTMTNRLSPVQIGSDSDWNQISAGDYHSIATKVNGTLWAWGLNAYGQLGDGTIIRKLVPTIIGTDSNWKKISSGGEYSMAIRTDGTLWTWGLNNYGQLGDGTNISKNIPTQVANITNCIDVEASEEFFSILLKANDQYCGTGYNQFGYLGDGTTINRTTFNCADGSDKKAILAVGTGSSLLLKTDGTMWAWGSNAYGVLGDGTMNSFSASPKQIGSDINWAQISTNLLQSLALKTNGTLWSWGMGGYVGDGTETNRLVPVQIGTAINWSQISAGDEHSLAIKTDGSLWTWGVNAYGEFGNGNTTNSLSPIQIGTATNWSRICAGWRSSFAIKTDGTLWAWGNNQSGELGDGTIIQRNSPVQIGTDADWSQISSKDTHTLALKNNGTLWAWGDNTYGQLGNGTTTSTLTPVQIGTDTDWSKISSGSYNSSLALKNNGTLWAWGYNAYGVLGDGTTTNKYVPTQIPSMTNCIQAEAGSDFSIILKSNEQYCGTGRNFLGQLGDGTSVNKTSFNCLALPSALKSNSISMAPNSEESLQPNQAKSYLLQNYPNPTEGTTTINYVLEDNANYAKIVFYNFTGSIVRVYSMLSNGKSALEVNIGDFPAGIYSYALFVNGSKIDVKKLLLVK